MDNILIGKNQRFHAVCTCNRLRAKFHAGIKVQNWNFGQKLTFLLEQQIKFVLIRNSPQNQIITGTNIFLEYISNRTLFGTTTWCPKIKVSIKNANSDLLIIF